MFKKLLIITVLIGGGAVLWAKFCCFCNPPKLEEFDTNYWWGPNELKEKVDNAIKPFKVEFNDAMIKDLKDRIANRRKLTPPLEGVAFEYGFNSEYLERVLNYWTNSYNFKERENFFNKYKHYKTNIQGLDIHFIHVKPANTKNLKVLPLLLLHGWPGSVREFYEIIPMLTTPRDGYDFVFEVIAPSLPGYGFSSAAVRPGLGAAEVSVVMRNLMQRVGHKQFYVQGGDWGALIGSSLSTIFPNEVLGFHTNMATISTTYTTLKTFLGAYWPSLVVEDRLADRMYPLSNFFSYLMEETGYMHIQSTKPDTIGTALSESPVAMATYILEKFSTWTNPSFKSLPDGGLTRKFSLTNLLDNIMVYWSTNSITSSVRLYAESFSKRHQALNVNNYPTPVPSWALQAKYELAFQPVDWLKEKYTNMLNATTLDDGGHFIAFEMPEETAKDIFKAVKAFIEFRSKIMKTEL